MLTLSAGVLGLKLESNSNLMLAFWFALFCLLNKEHHSVVLSVVIYLKYIFSTLFFKKW